MNKDGMLRSLEIGSRQLGLFGDDDQTSADQERFRNRVAGYCEKHGQVAALDAVRDAAITLGFSETWCLQQLFWMVQELEVNFRANGRTIAPARPESIWPGRSRPRSRLRSTNRLTMLFSAV